jgi:hypothetical protein
MSFNIKWNWGTKLLIAIILFMSLIFYLVYLSTKQDLNLVEEDYYPKGLKYQARINEIKNAAVFKDQIQLTQTDSFVVLTLPDISPDSGSVVLFRPSNERLDINSRINPDTLNRMYFSMEQFRKGLYIYKIEWFENGNGYYLEDKFYIK